MAKATGRTRSTLPPIVPPELKALIVAIENANAGILAALDALKTFREFEKVNRKQLNGKWKKLIPKLGQALRDMLNGGSLPEILKRLKVDATTLADRDTVVTRIQTAINNSDTLGLLLGNLLSYEKGAYFSETTGAVADIRTLLGSNLIIDATEEQQVRDTTKHVLTVGDEIAQEPLDTRKTKKAFAEAVLLAEANAKKDPAMDAKEMEIKVLRGGSIDASDLTKDGVPAGGRKRASPGPAPAPSGSGRRSPGR